MGCGSSKDARGETATTSGIGTYPSCVIEWCRGLDAIFTFGRGATVLGTYASRAYAVDKDECCVRLATSTTVPRKPKGCGQRGWVEARERVNQSVVGSLDSLECLSAPTGLSCASPRGFSLDCWVELTSVGGRSSPMNAPGTCRVCAKGPSGSPDSLSFLVPQEGTDNCIDHCGLPLPTFPCGVP
jgi:hypothetical protein